MKKSTLIALAFSAAGFISLSAKDDIIMSVNGSDVPLSEFEYLYNKNRQQQIDPLTLDQYVEMFKIYKLKVADALERKLDTTASFKKEMLQYKNDLSNPYLVDSLYVEQLIKEAFDRSRFEVETFHIMLPKGDSFAEQKANLAKADSLRSLLLNGANFEELATRYSVDGATNKHGGRMGFITEGNYPYSFEKTAFDLQPGEISDIVDSGMGYHILKGGIKRPARGQVLVEHIMKMVNPNFSPQEKDAAKASIDSIYAVVAADPDKFEELARQLSDDLASKKKGGKLNWFGAGAMVEAFDEAAFALAPGEISKPVESLYGWHVIKKLDSREPAGFEEMKPIIMNQISTHGNDRTKMIRRHSLDILAKRFKLQPVEKNITSVCTAAAESGLNKDWYADAASGAQSNLVIAKLGKIPVTLSDYALNAKKLNIAPGDEASVRLNESIHDYLDQLLIEAEQDRLYDKVPAYRNLLNEYREGSLLYEVSLIEVWDKAAQDTEGLTNYFENHRDDYSWQNPHVKGILVQCTDDSIADLVRNRLANMKEGDDLKNIRKEFAGKAAIDRILMEEGQNPMVDNAVFNGDPVKPGNKRYTVYFVWDPKMLTRPEVMEDVKGLVTSDYQNQLESDWVEKLKAKYPVTVYEKVVKKVK